MKLLISLMLLTLLTGCGIAESLRDECGSDIEMGCNAVFGYKDKDLEEKNKEQDNRLKLLEERVTELENQVDSNYNILVNINNDLQLLRSDVDLLNDVDGDLQQQIDNLITQLNNQQSTFNNSLVNLTNLVIQAQQDILLINNELDNLDIRVTNINVNVNTPNGITNNTVVDIIDPCGNFFNGMDEIILKTKGNEYLAYYEVNGHRFLSKLQNGTYTTTDGTGCTFTIAGSHISW